MTIKVDQTSTSEDGYKLYKNMLMCLHSGNITLDFEGTTSMSSNFFCCSIGHFIDLTSLEYVKRRVKIANVTVTQKEILKRFLENYK